MTMNPIFYKYIRELNTYFPMRNMNNLKLFIYIFQKRLTILTSNIFALSNVTITPILHPLTLSV